MYYIVGLGNPGEKYENTRHNVGWLALDHFIETHNLPSPISSSKYAGHISEGVVEGAEIFCLYPNTFMNKSGASVCKAFPCGNDPDTLIVLHDEVDLGIGEVKISKGKGPGGHNGVASIIQSLGTKDFVRIRIGIAPRSFFGHVKRPSGEKMTRHVLGSFKKKEGVQLSEVYKKINEIISTILGEGSEIAMNRFN